MIEKIRLYRTADLALATFLTMRGLRLVAVRPLTDRTAEFQLRDSDERQALVMEFLNRRGSVDPATFLDRLKQLKAAAVESRVNGETAGVRHA